MSVISLAGLRGNKGLAKGVNKVDPNVNISPASASLLYSSAAPEVTGSDTGPISITAVAGALLYSSSAPTINAGSGTAGEPIGLLLALTKAA